MARTTGSPVAPATSPSGPSVQKVCVTLEQPATDRCKDVRLPPVGMAGHLLHRRGAQGGNVELLHGFGPFLGRSRLAVRRHDGGDFRPRRQVDPLVGHGPRPGRRRQGRSRSASQVERRGNRAGGTTALGRAPGRGSRLDPVGHFVEGTLHAVDEQLGVGEAAVLVVERAQVPQARPDGDVGRHGVGLVGQIAEVGAALGPEPEQVVVPVRQRRGTQARPPTCFASTVPCGDKQGEET